MDGLSSNIALFSVVMAGGFIVYFLEDKVTKYFKYILAFSGAFLLAISVLHVIPEVYQAQTANIGLFVLLGFLIQLVLEYFSQGIEHGHFHVNANNPKLFLVPILVSLCLHAFLEGLPLVNEISNEHHVGHSHSNSLLFGILLHKFPISIALMTLFLKAKLKMNYAFFGLLIFAIMAPLGNFIGVTFQDSFTSHLPIFDYILAIVLGMFLHISTTILFESDESHKFNLMKLIVIIAGGGIAYLVV